jgi:hypothetical protein
MLSYRQQAMLLGASTACKITSYRMTAIPKHDSRLKNSMFDLPIGATMKAVAEAHAQAAKTTVHFMAIEMGWLCKAAVKLGGVF